MTLSTKRNCLAPLIPANVLLCPVSHLVCIQRTVIKDPLLLSFHMFQIMYITTPLKCRCLCLGIFAAASTHQELISVGWVYDLIRLTSKCSQVSTMSQNCLAGHSRLRWRPDSSGPLHMTQWSWCGQFLSCRLLAGEILFWMRIQAKQLTKLTSIFLLGSKFTCGHTTLLHLCDYSQHSWLAWHLYKPLNAQAALSCSCRASVTSNVLSIFWSVSIWHDIFA